MHTLLSEDGRRLYISGCYNTSMKKARIALTGAS